MNLLKRGSMKYKNKNNDIVIRFDFNQRKEDFLKQLKLKTKDIIHIRNKQMINDDYIDVDDEIIIVDSKPKKEIEPSFKDIEIVYEDEIIVILNKEIDILTHPDGSDNDTLLNRLKAHYILKGQDINPRVLHRLDKATSGLIIFLKNAALQAYFDELLNIRKIKRSYLALVHGNFKAQQKIKLDYPIARNRHLSGTYHVYKSGKASISYGRCIKNYFKANFSLMEMSLETGRTHQLRVHLAHIKHPIIGDLIYGVNDKNSRMFLQAYKLVVDSFFHNNLVIEIEMDNSFKKYINKYGSK